MQANNNKHTSPTRTTAVKMPAQAILPQVSPLLPGMPNNVLLAQLLQQQQQLFANSGHPRFLLPPSSMPASILQQKQQKHHETESVTTSSPSSSGFSSKRKWQLSFPKHEGQGKPQLEGTDLSIHITMKIRGEEAKSLVPDKLYSSHKYVIQHHISGKVIANEYPLLVAKLCVVDPMKIEEEILKNGKPIVKGSTESAITRGSNDNGAMQGTMKAQFTDVSYHHEKKLFAFKISYFDPSKLESPLFVLLSPSFRTYARKPTDKKDEKKTKRSGTKRSATSAAETTGIAEQQDIKQETPPEKKQKVPVATVQQQPSNAFDSFSKKLEELVALKEKLSDEDRKIASEWSVEKLLSVDPEYTMNLLLNPEQSLQANAFLIPNSSGVVSQPSDNYLL